MTLCDFCQRPKRIAGELIGNARDDIHICRACIKSAQEQGGLLPNGWVAKISNEQLVKEGFDEKNNDRPRH